MGNFKSLTQKRGSSLPRKAAFIPINIIPNFDAAEAEIERWRAVAEQRRQGEAGPCLIRLNGAVDDKL